MNWNCRNLVFVVFLILDVGVCLAAETRPSLKDQAVEEQAQLANPTPADRTALELRWLSEVWNPQSGLLSRNLRPEESEGYFAILNHARELPLPLLKSAAERFQQRRINVVKSDPNYGYYFRKAGTAFPTFVDLHRFPEAYHGQLVTMTGHMRRLVTFPVEANAYGLQQLHEAWLYVDDAQQNPVVVVCSSLPEGIPTGGDMLVDFISVTGYFFKQYGYEDRAGQSRFAPLLLAKQLEWSPRSNRRWMLSGGTAFGIVVAVASLTGVAWWLFARRGGRATRHLIDHSAPVNSSDIFNSPTVNPDQHD